MKKILAISLICALECASFSLVIAKKPGINPPSDLSATAVSASQINLEWQDNSDNETGFKIERKEEGGGYSEIDEVGQNITTYSDTGLATSTTYYYRIRAFKQTGQKITYSDYSNEANATTFGLPESPTGLTAEVKTASTTFYVELIWEDNSSDEEGFSIERSTSSVPATFSEIDTVGENFAYYNDVNVESGVTYYYRVRAYNEVGYSDYSNIDSVTIP